MTNYNTDQGSKAHDKEIASKIFTEINTANYTPDEKMSTIGTLLHEMTHSFGVRGATFEIRKPDGTLKQDADGKTISSSNALEGENTQVMEELKAQTGCLYWIGWLQEKGVLTKTEAEAIYFDSLLWCFGHISNGMKDSSGGALTYSQLSAIQIHHLLKTGAMSVQEGKFAIDYTKLHESVKELFKTVIEIQVFGDKERADLLRKEATEGDGLKAIRYEQVKDIYKAYPSKFYDLQIKV